MFECVCDHIYNFLIYIYTYFTSKKKAFVKTYLSVCCVYIRFLKIKKEAMNLYT